MTTPDPSPARAPWYRSPWPMLIVAVAAAAALVIGLGLRFLADPRPGEAVTDLRQFALIFGMAAFLLAGYAITTSPTALPSFGRALILKILPRLDQTPPPVTATAARWTPISQRIAILAWGGAALWYVAALVGWLIGRVL